MNINACYSTFNITPRNWNRQTSESHRTPYKTERDFQEDKCETPHRLASNFNRLRSDLELLRSVYYSSGCESDDRVYGVKYSMMKKQYAQPSYAMLSNREKMTSPTDKVLGSEMNARTKKLVKNAIRNAGSNCLVY